MKTLERYGDKLSGYYHIEYSQNKPGTQNKVKRESQTVQGGADGHPLYTQLSVLMLLCSFKTSVDKLN